MSFEKLSTSKMQVLLHLDGSTADSSANNRAVVATTAVGATGHFGTSSGSKNGYYFPGSSKLSLGVTTSLTAFTCVAWIYIMAYPATGKMYTLFSKNSYYAASYTDFPFYSNIATATGALSSLLSKGNDYTIDDTLTSKHAMPLNKWFMYGTSYAQSASHSLFADGEFLTSSINFNISTTSYSWTFGQAAAEYSGGVGTTSFIGFADEIFIENSTWTRTQFLEYYRWASGRFLNLNNAII